MIKRKSKYKRCRKCKELVIDVENCANCANRNPAAFPKHPIHGQRGSPSLDVIEGNSEEYFG